jgi:type II secretory pathway pseudopilin PulG
MIEIMIVLFIGAMVAALVIPVFGRTPARLAIRRASTDLQAAFTTAARRSRATGATVTLSLNPEEGTLQIADQGSVPSMTADGYSEGVRAPADEMSFKLPKDIEWDPGMDGSVKYTFLPNGRADGPLLSFTLRKRQFYIDLDHLTGRMRVIQEDG